MPRKATRKRTKSITKSKIAIKKVKTTINKKSISKRVKTKSTQNNNPQKGDNTSKKISASN